MTFTAMRNTVIPGLDGRIVLLEEDYGLDASGVKSLLLEIMRPGMDIDDVFMALSRQAESRNCSLTDIYLSQILCCLSALDNPKERNGSKTRSERLFGLATLELKLAKLDRNEDFRKIYAGIALNDFKGIRHAYEYPIVLMMMGECRMVMEDYRYAVKNLKRARSNQVNEATRTGLLAECYSRLADDDIMQEGAAAKYALISRHHGNMHWKNTYIIADSLAAFGEFNLAYPYYQEIIDQRKANEKIFAEAARCAAEVGDFGHMNQYFGRAVEILRNKRNEEQDLESIDEIMARSHRLFSDASPHIPANTFYSHLEDFHAVYQRFAEFASGIILKGLWLGNIVGLQERQPEPTLDQKIAIAVRNQVTETEKLSLEDPPYDLQTSF